MEKTEALKSKDQSGIILPSCSCCLRDYRCLDFDDLCHPSVFLHYFADFGADLPALTQFLVETLRLSLCAYGGGHYFCGIMGGVTVFGFLMELKQTL